MCACIYVSMNKVSPCCRIRKHFTELRGAFLDDVVDPQHRHVQADAGVRLWSVGQCLFWGLRVQSRLSGFDLRFSGMALTAALMVWFSVFGF